MFYVIGGTNIDVFCKSNKDLIPRDSNPSKISFKCGGVARNIACNLANQKGEISFMTAFGNDVFGESLKKDLSERGINLEHSITSKDHTSSLYLAILDKEDLYVGVNDMSVTEEINEKTVSKLFELVKEDDYVFFDTDYNTEFIEYMADHLKGIKVVDAVSANKVIRLKDIENKIDILKCNLIEAEALCGTKIFNDDICASCVEYLLTKGTKEVIISGSDYMFVGNDKGITKYTHNLYNENPINITGAGDALLSYYVFGKSIGLSEEESVKRAFVAAAKTVDSDSTVVEFDIDEELIKIDLRKEKYK